MNDTKTASLDEIRKMHERGEVEAPDKDVKGVDMPEGFWDVATPQEPKTKKAVSLRVDPDILDFFKEQGNGHLTKMHAVLRSYVDAQKKRQQPSPK